MSNTKKLLADLDKISTHKFPGYWKGTDSAKLAKKKMVGSAQESILPEIHQIEKTTRLERKLKESLRQFKLEEYANAQDPNRQTTSPPTPATTTAPQDEQQKKKDAQAQRVDVSAAKSLASSIKPELPPNIDANTLASAIVKINDNKPLTQPEQVAMGPMSALVTKAAETTQTSNELATILRTASQLVKKGKA